MLSTFYSRLTEITTLPASAGVLLTCGASPQKLFVMCIVLHNTGAAGEEVTLYNVPDATGSVGTAGATNQFFKDTIVSEDTVFIEFPRPGLILQDQNDTIQGFTDTVSTVTVQIFGGTGTDA